MMPHGYRTLHLCTEQASKPRRFPVVLWVATLVAHDHGTANMVEERSKAVNKDNMSLYLFSTLL